MSADLLITWPLIFLRAIGVVMLVPQMAGRSPPIMVRLGLAFCLTTLLTGVVPPAHVPATPWGFIAAAAGETAMGLAMGFVAHMAFSGVELAGRIASSEVGLSAPAGIGAPEIASEPLAGFLGAFAVILFFLFGGHLFVLTAFARSFSLAAPGAPLLNPHAGEEMIVASARVIELGLRMAAPFIGLNFLVTLAFGVLGRAVPRIGIFVLSAPVRGVAGLALFAGAGGLMARYLFAEFSLLPARILHLVASR